MPRLWLDTTVAVDALDGHAAVRDLRMRWAAVIAAHVCRQRRVQLCSQVRTELRSSDAVDGEPADELMRGEVESSHQAVDARPTRTGALPTR